MSSVPSAAAVEAAARELWRIGNERIGLRDWVSVAPIYVAAATAALRAAYAVDGVAPPSGSTPNVASGSSSVVVGLTVAQLAALLREAPWTYAPGWAESLAAWLLPQLGLGAPP